MEQKNILEYYRERTSVPSSSAEGRLSRSVVNKEILSSNISMYTVSPLAQIHSKMMLNSKNGSEGERISGLFKQRKGKIIKFVATQL